jgi:hypothetical protein
MRLNILFGLTLFIFLMTGCATARIWQEENSQIQTPNEEMQMAIHRCEQNDDVVYYHKRVIIWSDIGTGTVLIPFLGLGMVIAGNSLADKYVLSLTKCMQENGFYYVERKSGRLKWNKLSDFDISMEQWNKEHLGNQVFRGGEVEKQKKPITSTPITPSSPTRWEGLGGLQGRILCG